MLPIPFELFHKENGFQIVYGDHNRLGFWQTIHGEKMEYILVREKVPGHTLINATVLIVNYDLILEHLCPPWILSILT
jgi:hypothetical protein